MNTPEHKFFMLVTPNQHEKNEWSRFATAAYAAGRNEIGHTFSTAASLPNAGQIRLAWFDALQNSYREWLVFGRFLEVQS